LKKPQNNTLIVICGPTAIGKTAVSIKIAKILNSQIISADSRQFYRELKIGVAAPEKEELKAVSHHFIGHISVTDDYNVSRFENEVVEFLESCFRTTEYAVMVGGSGLYINAVCKGIDNLPDSDKAIREQLQYRLETEGLQPLKKQLKELDPEYYRIVDRKNPNRILRALEVCLITGKTYSSLRNNQPKDRNFQIIKIGLNRSRSELFERIENRVDDMIEKGLVQEVQSLIPWRERNALNTVGYKEIFSFIDGFSTLEESIRKIKTHTRRYAKRQLTWFTKDKSIQWFHPDEVDEIIDYIRSKK
jgi:tRNA dimethylallyltransferase